MSADVIYVTEDLRQLAHLRRHPFSLRTTFTGLTYSGPTEALSPDAHFSCSNPGNPGSREYDLCSLPTPVIQAYAYYPIPTRQPSIKDMCVPNTPPIILPRYDSLLPIDVTDALYRKEAFWALPFAPFESSNDKWTWTYLVQKTIMEFDFSIQIASMSPKAIFKSHMDLSYNAQSVDKVVKGFQSKSNFLIKSLYTLFVKTMVELSISESIIHQQLEWLKSMHQLEGNPNIWTNNDKQEISCSDKVTFYPWKRFPVNSNVEVANKGKIDKTHHNFCKNENQKVPSLHQPWIQFRNIALVIIYKEQLSFDTLPLVETLYRPFFPIMVYCSKRPATPVQTARDHTGWKIISVEYDPVQNLQYQCVSLVVHLGLPVDGFMFLGEDVLFSVHDIPTFSLSRTWLPTPHSKCSSRQKTCNIFHDTTPTLDVKVLAAHKELDYMAHPLARIFRKRRQQFLGHADLYVVGLTDFYYLPYTNAHDVNTLLELYLKQGVPGEVAIPTLLTCLTMDKPPLLIPSISGWKKEAEVNGFNHIPLILNGNATFLHSTQWNLGSERNLAHVHSYCTEVLPFMYNKKKS